MMPKSDVIELDMSVDAALKYIISMGVVAPANGKKHSGQPQQAALLNTRGTASSTSGDNP
jgi:uncharacterized membrane protein